jgi:thiol:disulfide interchange protein DsbC
MNWNHRKMRTSGFLVAGLLLTVGHGLAAEVPPGELVNRLKTLYPGTQVTDVASSELSGLFEVVMGRNIAYTDATGRYFIFGHLYDMTAQRDLTAERRDQLQRIDFGTLPLHDAIKTVRGNGSRVLAVFSDPDCPYCKSLEPELAKLDDVTVYTFLMPLAQLHPQARTKAIAVWCAADPVSAWARLMLRGEIDAKEDCQHPVDRNVALGERLQINGTPTSIAADGRVLAGAVNAAQIEAWLSRTTKRPLPAEANVGATP